eukprot:1162117-Pelagomonas_calceolata.AAC.7
MGVDSKAMKPWVNWNQPALERIIMHREGIRAGELRGDIVCWTLVKGRILPRLAGHHHWLCKTAVGHAGQLEHAHREFLFLVSKSPNKWVNRPFKEGNGKERKGKGSIAVPACGHLSLLLVRPFTLTHCHPSDGWQIVSHMPGLLAQQTPPPN